MNAVNQISGATTQVSGAVTIGSALSSRTAEYVASSADATPLVVENAAKVMISADQLAMASFVVMLMSAIWNVFSTRRRDKGNRELKERELKLKERELALKEAQMKKNPE